MTIHGLSWGFAIFMGFHGTAMDLYGAAISVHGTGSHGSGMQVFHGSALGISMEVTWDLPCHVTAISLPGHCNCHAMTLTRVFHDTPMTVPWHCHGSRRKSHGGSMAVP